MKCVVITLTLECADDVPAHVLEWMAGNLAEHAAHEFDCDYEPEFSDPPYDGPPIAGDVTVAVNGVEVDWTAGLRQECEAAMQRIERMTQQSSDDDELPF